MNSMWTSLGVVFLVVGALLLLFSSVVSLAWVLVFAGLVLIAIDAVSRLTHRR